MRTSPSVAHSAPDRAGEPSSVIKPLALLAFSLGIVAGLAHAGRHLWVRLVEGRMTWETPDVPWMSPLANALILLGVAVMAWSIWRVTGRRLPVRLLDAAVCFVAVFAVLLLVPRVHSAASAVFSAGAAWVLSSLIAAQRRRARRVVHYSAAVGLALSTAAALYVRARPSDLAPAPVNADAAAPNVLLLILDTVRAASTSLYGYERPTTPAMARLADEGTRFEFAMASAPWTLPSHASMFAGRYPGELAQGWRQPLRDPGTLLAESMRAAGYRTGGFVANNWYTSRESGLARGFDTYSDFGVDARQLLLTSTLIRAPLVYRLLMSRSVGDVVNAFRPNTWFQNETVPPYPRKGAREVTDEFLAWQQQLGGRPFFAFLNYYDAHAPYQPPDSIRRRFIPAGAKVTERDLYEASIAALDAEIGRLTDSLRALGVLDRTILIVTSDHGEQFGEHGKFGHGNGVYPIVLHVPLVVRWPGAVPAAATVRGVVSLRDLGATIADYVGGVHFPGASLRAAIEGSRAGLSPAAAQYEGQARVAANGLRGASTAVFNDSLQLVVLENGETELYRYREDPTASIDLSENPAFATLLAAFKVEHDSLMTQMRPPSAEPDSAHRK